MAGTCWAFVRISRNRSSDFQNVRRHSYVCRMKPLAFAAALLSFGSLVFAAEIRIAVEAGDFDRRDTVVHFQLPADSKPGNVLSGDGSSVALQTSGRDALFVVRELKRGDRKTYVLDNAGVRQSVHAIGGNGFVELRVFNKTALVYRTEKTALPAERPDLTPVFQR